MRRGVSGEVGPQAPEGAAYPKVCFGYIQGIGAIVLVERLR